MVIAFEQTAKPGEIWDVHHVALNQQVSMMVLGPATFADWLACTENPTPKTAENIEMAKYFGSFYFVSVD